MMKLKKYQKRVLNSLSAYLKSARSMGASTAFEQQVKRPYCTIPQLPGLPYVCLRVPTGGGKTLISSHSISMVMRDFLQMDNSVTIWLVPTTQIKDQTLESLRDVEHPYRKALDETIETPVTVLDITEALFLQRNTLDNETLIIVSTLAALRIEDTDGRRIYDDNGHLRVHFNGINELVLERMEKNEAGNRIVYSLANLLKSRRPIIIIDEAHNARTNLSFDTLARFDPSCIVEYTATPETLHDPSRNKFASNVLCSVSAAELFAENMIKLPIRLETKTDWKEIVSQAIVRRKRLQVVANKERRDTGEYIRPILLFQAQPRSQTRQMINTDVLLQALQEDFKIPREEIAIATGEEKELEGINLFSEDCRIKYIITVSALKEGWDCSFAYVLCSIAELGSSTAVEQLVGRVLRLPKAVKKNNDELNKAYAYVSSSRFNETLNSLSDALVENGFERFEAKTLITPNDYETDIFNPDNYISEVIVTHEPNFESLAESIKSKMTFHLETKKIEYRGKMTMEEKEAIQECFPTIVDKEKIFSLFNQTQEIPVFEGSGYIENPTTEQRKISKDEFKIPYLAYFQEDLFKVFEESMYLDTNWELSECNPMLTEEDFSVKSTTSGQIGEISVTEQGKIESRFIQDLSEQLTLQIEVGGWTIVELTNWLDKRIPHPDITSKQSTLFIHKVIEYLLDSREINLNELVHNKHKLREAIERLIDSHRKEARRQAYQAVIDLGEDTIVVDDKFVFSYHRDIYPANWYYEGHVKFNKHYHSEKIGELKSAGEEFDCAMQLDQLPEVKHWIRNLDSNPKYSFWLQRPGGKFYPDFVAELNDGRLLVVEYKGDHIKEGTSEKEKKAIGELWASRSNGKCLFFWATKDNISTLRDFVK